MRPGAKEALLYFPKLAAGKLFTRPAEKAIKLERRGKEDSNLSQDKPGRDRSLTQEHTVVAFTHRYDPAERKLQRTMDL